MCGIAGIINTNAGPPDHRIEAMIGALAHRGPDAEGVWFDPHCALGHRRLAIIDLSDAGRQPMSSEDGRLWITFNGEIYNYLELRRLLEGRGYRFRTRTDTETIIHAYREWGVECLKRLRGMFAFAIWDREDRKLFLARDRVGKKPLFYSHLRNGFVFASELQGVLAHGEVSRETDWRAIDAYLSYGYIPAPRTAFQNILKLPPAHFMTLEMKDGGTEERIERYWSLDYSSKLDLTEREAAEALREKLSEAVRLRLISDVPLGAFLSGGIDSSIVVGLMAKLSDRPVKTFSIGFKEAEFDELDHARRIADKWSTDHQEFIVEPDAASIIEGLVRHFGEPFADSSAVPTYYVSRITRRSVTVALNGDGGDESFAGYERYLGNYLAERLNSAPGFAWSARALNRALPRSLNQKSRLRQAARFLSVAAEPMTNRYARWLTYFPAEAKSRLYKPEFSAEARKGCASEPEDWLGAILSRVNGLNPIDAAMSADVVSYLPYDLLVKVDITSMMNSLEARSPFLDHEVMEFAAALPVELKARGGKLKYLLKTAFKDMLPPENVRRRKMGFGVPVAKWFHGPMRELLRDTLLASNSGLGEFLNRAEVERLLADHLERRADNAPQLWNLLMLELWMRRENKRDYETDGKNGTNGRV